jgi:hypothetical protein
MISAGARHIWFLGALIFVCAFIPVALFVRDP